MPEPKKWGAVPAPAGRIAYVNGRYLPHGQAGVHIEDRGLQLGDSIYEVTNVLGGVPIDEEAHLDRMERSLAEIGMAMPMGRAALKQVMREVIARLVDDSAWLDFKADYGSATLCGHARIDGYAVAFITNNGPIDPAGATKAAQFIHLCNQSGTPIVFLQNTTGFIVGRASEEAGMIKHGAKMIQALSNSQVPHITVYCGASFGAGNYGMCGRAFHPRFCFSWPNARSSVMGGEQAATTLDIVARQQAERSGKAVDEARLLAQKTEIVGLFESQASAFYTSGHVLDDGIIDPRQTRDVLSLLLATLREAAARTPHAMQFAVPRF